MEPETIVVKNEVNELADALSKAQGEMGSATKDASNPFFKSKYADLASVIYAIKEPFAKHGLSFSQCVNSTDDGKTFVETYLLHKSGQFIKSRMFAKPTKEDMQGLGSAISYARRYGLQAIAGLPAEDDDGESAVGRSAHGQNGTSKERFKRGSTYGKIARENATEKELEALEAISPEQGKELLETAEINGWTKDDVKGYAETLGYAKLRDINELDYFDILEHFRQKKSEWTEKVRE